MSRLLRPSDFAKGQFMRRDDAHAALAGGPARRSLGDGGDEDEFGAAADGRSRSRRSACRVLEVPLQDRVRRVVADVAAMTGVGTRPVRHDGRALAAVVIAHAVAVAQAVLGEPLLQFVLDGENRE